MPRHRSRHLSRRRPEPVPNNASAVLGFMAARPPAAEGFVEVAVAHDDGCAIWTRGVWSCNAEVKDMAEYRRERARRN
jgi:hypothetical protein